jgi:hypothetical protein
MKIGLAKRIVENTRKMLAVTRTEIMRLETLRHAYDHVSCMGIASSAKMRYLLGCSVFNEDGSPYWNSPQCYEEPDVFLERIMAKINQESLEEHQFRELARTEPWRSMWALRNHCGRGAFDVASTDLTDEQRVLMTWSTIYDSIQEHPDNLSESLVADDDMVDGWMIIKRRERETNQNQDVVDNLIKGNQRISNAQEIFVVPQSAEMVKLIQDKNQGEAKFILSERMKAVKRAGEAGVSEQNLPDVTRKIQQQRHERFMQQAKNK